MLYALHRYAGSIVGLCLMLGAAVASAGAQDRRIVQEPALPSRVCVTLLPSRVGMRGDDTTRLQSAIDACSAGAAVRLLAGRDSARFVSGPLVMKSGVTLWLDAGAVLAASTDPHAYDRGSGRCGTIDKDGKACRPFILFQGTKGGGIVGDGLIDGQGEAVMAGKTETWWQLARRAQKDGGNQNVPRLIQIDHARDITFYGIMLRDAPNFHVAMTGVTGATFWSIRIDTPADARNTDGIDPGASQDITIAHSFIRTGDDDIAIKAGQAGATRYVSILDTHLYWGHGMSIGSETVGGVSNILVRGMTLDGTTAGLRIKSDASRGGMVSQIRYENICMRGNRRPIEFDTRYDAAATGTTIPVYRDIILHNVSGGDGDLVVRGHDAAHALAVRLDGVRFAPKARWQVENAQLSAGPGGIEPSPPGFGAAMASGTRSDCAGQWLPFPTGPARPVASGPAASALRVGPGERYTHIQAAADAAKPGETIFVQPGVYREIVHLRTPGVRLIGGGDSADAVMIEGDGSARDRGGTSHSATVFAEADGIEIDRLTIANRFHERHPEVIDGAQAVALSATGDRQRFIGLNLIGYQDTLYAGSRGCAAQATCMPARQYYKDSRIEGAVDFVFGDAQAYFERTELRGVDRAHVTLTAQGRRFPDQPSGYLFHDCTVTADPSVSTISLGRPWRDYATVSYVDCRLDARVLPQGFTEWQGANRLPTARYLIAGATGPGATSGLREPWLLTPDATTLSRTPSPDRFFEGWIPG